mmetsp:Transcript_819/g.1586  ORF Transcript_819/g.1586 Transcript_819/m.1586 type:complete len:108 (-) Transcript_819:493-816(-)
MPSDLKSNGAVGSRENGDAEKPVVKKRGRGRPRKYPPQEKKTAGKKRGRGRPRKNAVKDKPPKDGDATKNQDVEEPPPKKVERTPSKENCTESDAKKKTWASSEKAE